MKFAVVFVVIACVAYCAAAPASDAEILKYEVRTSGHFRNVNLVLNGKLSDKN